MYEQPAGGDTPSPLAPARGLAPINWVKALTLNERLPLLADLPEPGSDDDDRGRQHLEHWRSQRPFDRDDWLQRRLRLDGLTEATLRRLINLADELDLGAEAAEQIPAAAWAERALLRPTEMQSARAYKDDGVPFLALIDPLLVDIRESLRSALTDIQDPAGRAIYDPEALAQQLMEPLQQRMSGWLSRVGVLETNVARLEGRLRGSTPEERFDDFLGLCTTPELRFSIFAEYPVLLRAIAEHCQRWVEACAEWAERLISDFDCIARTFNSGQDPGPVSLVEPMQGDPHHGTRTVAILHFAQGLKLIYKPHSLRVDARFQELLAWCNARSDDFGFKTLKVLERQPDYGWIEFVEADECADMAGVERFYWRQGAYVALMYALAATDFHYENLIACGDQPVFVDLETLFHPGTESSSPDHADLAPELRVPASVVATNLLPVRIWGNNERGGVDLSGLGGEEGQAMPNPEPTVVDEGTDRIRVEPRIEHTLSQANRPRINGRTVAASEHLDALRDGFEAMYRFLVEHKRALLAAEGPINAFAGAKVRRILRPTYVYALILRDGFHPDYLRDCWRRERLFDGLWVDVPARPWLQSVIDDERGDLHRGDVPHFTAQADGREINAGADRPSKRCFVESGLALVRRRIQALDENDLRVQRWTIDASLAMVSPASETAAARPPASIGDDPPSLAAHADHIAERLMGLAIDLNDCAFWNSTTLNKSQQVMGFSPALANLYHGELGIALFLAYAGDALERPALRDKAIAAIEPIRRWVRVRHPSLLGPGVFVGYTGHIYVLAHLASLVGDETLLADAADALELVNETIDDDEGLSVLEGAAGTILALAAVRESLPDGLVLDVIQRCAARIAARAVPQDRGVGWRENIEGEGAPLTGFSHGTAGYAAALSCAGGLLDDAELSNLARAACHYERALFSPSHGNWPDLRAFSIEQGGGEAAYETAWCHGAPGIGIGRGLMLAYTDDADERARLYAEIEVAAERALDSAYSVMGGNHSLCHGTVGNLCIAQRAVASLGKPVLQQRLDEAVALLPGVLQSQGWRCGLGPNQGLALYQETPGLMTGLAGLGLGALHLAYPGRVPCALHLDPPPYR